MPIIRCLILWIYCKLFFPIHQFKSWNDWTIQKSTSTIHGPFSTIIILVKFIADHLHLIHQILANLITCSRMCRSRSKQQQNCRSSLINKITSPPNFPLACHCYLYCTLISSKQFPILNFLIRVHNSSKYSTD